MSSPRKTNTTTIAHNSLWFGLETGLSLIGVFLTSIAVARIIGPEKLGYFNYVFLLTQATTTLGRLGLDATTRKYMPEYLGKEQPGIARAIFTHTFRLQLMLTFALVAVSVAVVFLAGDPEYRWVSFFLVLSVLPRMLIFIPSGANMAAENMAANVPGAVAGIIVNVASTTLSLVMGWGLLGIAVGVALYPSVELGFKLWSVWRWLRHLPVEPLPEDLRKRMRVYSSQSVAITVLQFVVWGRSDIILLKNLQPDLREISYFSVAFNITERLLLPAQTFTTALGATLMAEYGRNRQRLFSLVQLASRYALLPALPLLIGAAALSGPIIRLVYGNQYLPAIPVFTLVALYAIPKALVRPAQNLLEATENQSFLIRWSILCGIVNAVVDFLLIPGMGATGAAIGNGTAQTLGALGLWYRAVTLFDLKLPFRSIFRIVGAGVLMGAGVVGICWLLPPPFQIPVGVVAGALIFGLVLRLTGALGPEDHQRLKQLGRHLPGPARHVFRRFIDTIAPALPTPLPAVGGPGPEAS